MHPCSCSVLAAASVLDYRPSTVAVAAVLAAAHGAMTKEALESKMSSLSLSSLLDKVRACPLPTTCSDSRMLAPRARMENLTSFVHALPPGR